MLNVLLVENDVSDSLLENALNTNGFNFSKILYSPSFLELTKASCPDVIIFNIASPCERLITDLHALNSQRPLPVIIFSEDGSCDTINKIINAEVSAYIVDGLTSHRVSSIIQVAIARFKQKKILQEDLEAARSQLEDRKQIDRAKAILIKTRNFTEHEAYHTLRKLAMDRNITLGEMSRNVIAMAELLK